MPARLSAGDPVSVQWLDIQEATNGDPADADLETWQTVGFFVRYCHRRGLRCLVLRPSRCTAEDETGTPDPQSGWLIIPTALVRRIHRATIDTSKNLMSPKRKRPACPRPS